jgi:hypothetical protein
MNACGATDPIAPLSPGERSAGRDLDRRAVATSESFHAVGPDVAVAFSLKHPLSLGSGYARPLATATSVAPAFTRREVSWPRSAKT